MSSDPAVVQASTSSPNKKQDDLDMAKLQKALKNDRRRSMASKNKVAKLTPAEIRSLNHSVGLSKNGSVRSIDNHSVRRLSSTATPPLTPDNYSSSRRSESQRRASADLPTPPLSPDRERRGSTSSTRYIHAPKPLSHSQAVSLANVGGLSRPSSQTSYRGMVTYRGNELTRNNSLTMLQHPSQVIVSNPLSQFSRPRQSTVTSTTSPSKPSSEQQKGEGVMNAVGAKERAQSLVGARQDFTRGNSPVRNTDSPVSMLDGEGPQRLVNGNHPDVEPVPVVHVTPKNDAPSQPEDQAEPTAKQKSIWRRTLTGSSEPEPEIVPIRKEFRRRTLLSPKNGYCLHAIHYADTKPGQPPQLRDSLRNELPSAKTSAFKDDDERIQAAQETEYGQHPAVRPLNQDTRYSTASESDSSISTSINKGKEREIDPPDGGASDNSSLLSSVPSYSRCSCCGRIQKPGGFESELSPVMENENLRTNFSFEVERMSPNRRRRSSSINADAPRRYIPIIPMEIGNETKQARIEPMREPVQQPAAISSVLRGVAVNKPGDIIGPGSMPLAIMPRRKIDPRVVRFASLHRTKDEKENEQDEQKPAEPAQSLAPPPQMQRFGSLYGLRQEAQQQQQQPQPLNPDKQSAYQAQQMRQQQQQRQRTNGNHPLRMSYSAHLETTLPHTATDTEGDVVEQPLSDSPVSRRTPEPSPPRSDISDEIDDNDDQSDDGEVVDLSSFDGSYVYGSLARSATINHDVSPPSTGQGQPPINNYNQNSSSDVSSATNSFSSAQSVPLPVNSNTPSSASTNSSHQHPQPQLQPTTPRQPPPPLTTNLSDSSTKTTIYSPMTTNSNNNNTTTIVRIVPSATVSVTDSPASAKGPLRLGDWILPESPSTQSLSSRKGSIQSESRRGVAAA